VLVVDDEEAVRGFLSRLLSRSGYRCLEACDAEQAIELLTKHRPDLGVLDLALPGISGAELAWRMRERMPDIPLVAVSGQLQSWDLDDLADLGFARVFPKPLDCGEFIRCCREVCAEGIGSTGSCGSPKQQ
jgi:CheY-like chemotaxis protein